jgi:hypothetical protein
MYTQAVRGSRENKRIDEYSQCDEKKLVFLLDVFIWTVDGS